MSISTAAAPRRHRRRLAPYGFLLPAIVLFVITFLAPIVYAVGLSLFARRVPPGSGIGRRTEVFVGLENYLAVFADAELFASLQRLGVYAVIVIPVTMLGALAAALLLDLPRQRLVRFSRIAILLPYAVPGVISALLWGFLYLPGTSPASQIARALGGGSLDFLSQPQLFGALGNIAIWGALGFNMIIMYTALRAIPAELYDAARLDGCGEWAIALRIKVPLMLPSIVLAGIFSIIGTVQAYSEPMIIRSISSSVSSTFFPLMTVYREAFHADNVNGAAAMSVVIAAAVLLLSFLVLRLAQRLSAKGAAR